MVDRKHPDQDAGKGAFEDEHTTTDRDGTNTSLGGQLGHRTNNEMIKDSDSDFPEPGGNPEHSGEPEEPRAPEAKPPQRQNAGSKKGSRVC